MPEVRRDVAIVGAGPVGLAAALALAQAGLRVVLVGPEPERRDGRTAALLAGSIELLASLGVWPALQEKAGPLHVLRIVDDTGSLFRPPPAIFRADEIGLDAFGWNIPNAELARGLSEAARREGGLDWRPELVEDFATGSDVATLRLAGGSTIEARLVVAADGRLSRVRELAGIAKRERRYPQSAFTTILGHELEHHETSTEFHTRAGPFTLVPLPGRRSSLVWVTAPAHARRLLEAGKADLARAIEGASHRILGSVEPDGPRGCVALASVSVASNVGPRLALAGEAAHVLPPIGAQGLNLGFADVSALRDLVNPAWRRGADIGGNAVLASYNRARRTDVAMRSAVIDGVNRALLTDWLPLDAARGFGLGLVSRVPALRRLVMQAGVRPVQLRAGPSGRTGAGASGRP